MCEKSPSFSSWTMSLTSLLYNLGLNFAWDYQNFVNQNVFLHLCKQRLQDLYLTKWNAALSASSDGLIYKSYNVMPCYCNLYKNTVPRRILFICPRVYFLLTTYHLSIIMIIHTCCSYFIFSFGARNISLHILVMPFNFILSKSYYTSSKYPFFYFSNAT